MAIHEHAAVGFSRAAAEYERVRPGYPTAAIELLARELDLRPGRRALDLAAGTGKLTRLLAATGVELVAVEPVDEMRAQLRRTVPGIRTLAGTAEAIPLAGGAVDAALVAQAFHWFDAARAQRELHRVLAPGGGLALVWNEWDYGSSRAVARVGRVVEAARADTPQYPRGDWRGAFEAVGLFEPLRRHDFANPQEAPREDVVARVATISFVAAMPAQERERLLADVRAALADEPEPVRFSYRTDVFVTWRR